MGLAAAVVPWLSVAAAAQRVPSTVGAAGAATVLTTPGVTTNPLGTIGAPTLGGTLPTITSPPIIEPAPPAAVAVPVRPVARPAPAARRQ